MVANMGQQRCEIAIEIERAAGKLPPKEQALRRRHWEWRLICVLLRSDVNPTAKICIAASCCGPAARLPTCALGHPP